MLVVDNVNVDEYDPNAKPVYYLDESESDGESMMRIDVNVMTSSSSTAADEELARPDGKTIDEHVT